MYKNITRGWVTVKKMAEYKKRKKRITLIPCNFKLIKELDFKGEVIVDKIPTRFVSKYENYLEVKPIGNKVKLIRINPIDFSYYCKKI